MAVVKIFRTVSCQKLRQVSVLQSLLRYSSSLSWRWKHHEQWCEVSVCETSALQVKRPQTVARAAVCYKTHSGSVWEIQRARKNNNILMSCAENRENLLPQVNILHLTGKELPYLRSMYICRLMCAYIREVMLLPQQGWSMKCYWNMEGFLVCIHKTHTHDLRLKT